MILVVTGIGSLIHLYSIGYMRDDPRSGRFFAYLNLFVFFMLMLVLGANYLLLYLGWEGVGVCSYLLIGFWFEKVANAEAAKKAFITTRIGDSLMLVGLAMIVFQFGSLDFEEVFGAAPAVLTQGLGDRDRAAPPRGSDRQVGPDPVARLAPRRDGGALRPCPP